MGAITVDRRGAAKTGRRAFLGVSALAGVAAGFFSAPLLDYLRAAPETPWRTFTPGEAAVLDAFLEELLPGAHAARVVRFLDWQLAPEAPLARKRDLYRSHLTHLRGRSAEEVEKTYPDFFALVLEHAKLGYYGNPLYGGNADGVAFRALGYTAGACAPRGA